MLVVEVLDLPWGGRRVIAGMAGARNGICLVARQAGRRASPHPAAQHAPRPQVGQRLGQHGRDQRAEGRLRPRTHRPFDQQRMNDAADDDLQAPKGTHEKEPLIMPAKVRQIELIHKEAKSQLSHAEESEGPQSERIMNIKSQFADLKKEDTRKSYRENPPLVIKKKKLLLYLKITMSILMSIMAFYGLVQKVIVLLEKI